MTTSVAGCSRHYGFRVGNFCCYFFGKIVEFVMYVCLGFSAKYIQTRQHGQNTTEKDESESEWGGIEAENSKNILPLAQLFVCFICATCVFRAHFIMVVCSHDFELFSRLQIVNTLFSSAERLV